MLLLFRLQMCLPHKSGAGPPDSKTAAKKNEKCAVAAKRRG
jgi:hypothetical protein